MSSPLNFDQPIKSDNNEWHCTIPDGTLVVKKGSQRGLTATGYREGLIDIVWSKLREFKNLRPKFIESPTKIQGQLKLKNLYLEALKQSIPQNGIGSEFELSCIRVSPQANCELKNRDVLAKTQDLKLTVETLGRVATGPEDSATLEAVTDPIDSAERLMQVFERFQAVFGHSGFQNGLQLSQAINGNDAWEQQKENPLIKFNRGTTLSEMTAGTQVTRAVPFKAFAKFLIESNQCHAEEIFLMTAMDATNGFFASNKEFARKLGLDGKLQGISEKPGWQLIFFTLWMTMKHTLISLCKDLEEKADFTKSKGNRHDSPYKRITLFGSKLFFRFLPRIGPGDMLRSCALPPETVKAFAEHFSKEEGIPSLLEFKGDLIEQIVKFVGATRRLAEKEKEDVLTALRSEWELCGGGTQDASNIIEYSLRQELQPGFNESPDGLSNESQRYKNGQEEFTDTATEYGQVIDYDEPGLYYSGTPFTPQYERLSDGSYEVCIAIEVRGKDSIEKRSYVGPRDKIDQLFHDFLKGKEPASIKAEAEEFFTQYKEEVLNLRNQASTLDRVDVSQPSSTSSEERADSTRNSNPDLPTPALHTWGGGTAAVSKPENIPQTPPKPQARPQRKRRKAMGPGDLSQA